MFERFTEPTRSVVMNAVALAEQRQCEPVGCRHFVEALLADPEAGPILQTRMSGLNAETPIETPPDDANRQDDDLLMSLGIDLDSLRRQIDEQFGAGAFDAVRRRRRSDRDDDRPHRRSRFDVEAKTVLERSLRHALRLRCRSIGPSHLALGVLDDADVVAQANLDADALRELRERLEAVAVEAHGPEATSSWWRRAG